MDTVEHQVASMSEAMTTLFDSAQRLGTELDHARKCAGLGAWPIREDWVWTHCDNRFYLGAPTQRHHEIALLIENERDAFEFRLSLARLGDPKARRSVAAILRAERRTASETIGLDEIGREKLLLELDYLGSGRNNAESILRLACRAFEGLGLPRSAFLGTSLLQDAIFLVEPAAGSVAMHIPDRLDEPMTELFVVVAPKLARRDIAILRRLLGDTAPKDDAHVAAWTPYWLSCLSQDPELLASWFKHTGAPTVAPGTGPLAPEFLFAYQRAIDNLFEEIEGEEDGTEFIRLEDPTSEESSPD